MLLWIHYSWSVSAHLYLLEAKECELDVYSFLPPHLHSVDWTFFFFWWIR